MYFLLCREQKPTRAELQNLLGRVEAKIALIKRLMKVYSNAGFLWRIFFSYHNRLKEKQGNSTVALKKVVPKFVESELECSVQNMGIDTGPADSCEIMYNQSILLRSALRKEAEAIAHYGSFSTFTDVDMLKHKKSKLETKKDSILSALREVNPLFGSIVKSNRDVIESVINSHKEDNWLQFEFDSKEMDTNSQYTSITTRSEFQTRSGGVFNRRTTTHIRTKINQQYESEMNQADLKAKGKLLRVQIKRPWFKPEVFDDRKLNFVSYLVLISYDVLR